MLVLARRSFPCFIADLTPPRYDADLIPYSRHKHPLPSARLWALRGTVAGVLILQKVTIQSEQRTVYMRRSDRQIRLRSEEVLA